MARGQANLLDAGRLAVLRLLAPLSGSARGPLIGILAVVGLLAFFSWAWGKYGTRVTAETRYQIEPERLIIPEKPSWVQADVRKEVVRDAGLSDLSLLDTDVTRKVWQAFQLHTWVAEVHRVSKRAGGHIEVDLTYRKPAIMVETDGGWWPVDTQGVLLPPREFAPSQTDHYLHVRTRNHQPAGSVGTPFGDPGVTGAARLATLLEGHWKNLGLTRIEVEQIQRPGAREPEWSYTLETRKGTRISWGSIPGEELTGELPAREKILRLEQFAAERGSLDSEDDPRLIDIRYGLSVREQATRLY